jgi:hypothetical protein
VIDDLMGSAQPIDAPGAPGRLPRLRPVLALRRSRGGGCRPGRSSALGGIEELRLLRLRRRCKSATSARSSSIAGYGLGSGAGSTDAKFP